MGTVGTRVMLAGSAMTGSQDQGKGVIAMEGRTRDGSSGEIVCMFADREHPPTAIVDIKALSWWDRQSRSATGGPGSSSNSRPTHWDQVKEMPKFEFLIW